MQPIVMHRSNTATWRESESERWQAYEEKKALQAPTAFWKRGHCVIAQGKVAGTFTQLTPRKKRTVSDASHAFLHSKIHGVFEEYARSEAIAPGVQEWLMDGTGWHRMCRDCKLTSSSRCTVADADLTFAKLKGYTTKLSFTEFAEGLKMVGEKLGISYEAVAERCVKSLATTQASKRERRGSVSATPPATPPRTPRHPDAPAAAARAPTPAAGRRSLGSLPAWAREPEPEPPSPVSRPPSPDSEFKVPSRTSEVRSTLALMAISEAVPCGGSEEEEAAAAAAGGGEEGTSEGAWRTPTPPARAAGSGIGAARALAGARRRASEGGARLVSRSHDDWLCGWIPPSMEEEVEKVFDCYCRAAGGVTTRAGGWEMDSSRFLRLCRDLGLAAPPAEGSRERARARGADATAGRAGRCTPAWGTWAGPRLPAAALDMIFSRSLEAGARKLTFAGFLGAMRRAAEEIEVPFAALAEELGARAERIGGGGGGGVGGGAMARRARKSAC